MFVTVAISLLSFLVPADTSIKKLNAEVLHPRMREWAYPVNGVKLNISSPNLLWPGVDGKDVQYKVILSSDQGFKKDLFEGKVQDYAVYPLHKTLKPGKWYWKYAFKKNGGAEWNCSEPYNFEIPVNAKNNTSLEAEVFINKFKTSHPRLWGMDKALKTFATNNQHNTEALSFIKKYKKLIGSELQQERPRRIRDTSGKTDLEKKLILEYMYHGFGEQVGAPIRNLCIAYQLTGDKTFINEATRQGMHVAAMKPDGLATHDDFNNGNVLEALGWLYDVAYNDLSGLQRNYLKDVIKIRGQRIYEDLVNRFELQMCDNHVWQHILRNFSIATVAVVHDLPDASNWLKYIYEVWTSRFPVLGSEDGGWHEGNGYFRVHYESLIYLPLLLGSNSGINYFETKWMKNLPYYLIYSYPPNSRSTEFGDQREDLETTVKGQALFAEALAMKVNNPYLNWYVEEIRKANPRFFGGDDDYIFFRLLNYSANKKYLVKKPLDIPKSSVFKDVGLVAMHSNMVNSERDMAVYFSSNPYGAAGHAHASQNAVTISYKGEKVFGGSGFYTNFSDHHNLLQYRNTRSYCTILADSIGQSIGENGYGWIARAMSSNRIQYALGDASSAYNNVTSAFWLDRFNQIKVKPNEKNGFGEPGVSKYRRHILHLDSNYIVLYDELEAVKPVKWTTQFHSPYQIVRGKLSDNSGYKSFVVTGKEFTATSHVFSGYETRMNIHDTFNYPAINWKGKADGDGNIKTYKNEWHTGIATEAALSEMRFLTIICLTPGKQSETINAQIKNDLHSFSFGDWTLTVNLDPSTHSLLAAISADGKSKFNFGQKELFINGKKFYRTKPFSSVIEETNGVKMNIQEVVDSYPVVVKTDIGFQNIVSGKK